MHNRKLTPLELVQQCPEGTMFSREAVLSLLRSAGEVEEGTPGQVAKILGRSAKYWRGVADEIPGSYREDSGRIYLPLSACRAHLAKKRAKREGPRGPYRNARYAPTSHADESVSGVNTIAPGLTYGRKRK